jgi:hypothetical protein
VAVDAEKFTNQADIGAPGELHLFRAVMEIEMPGKSLRECRRSRPARMNKRAVNIKQNEPHHPETLPESEDFRENIQVSCRIADPGSAGVPPAGGSPGTGRRDAGAPRKQRAASFRIARFAAGMIMPPDFMNEWNIQSRAHACEACGQPFADRQVYHTLLFDEPPELRRSDVCEACSQKQSAGDARSRAGFISHWQGIYEAPPPVSDPIHKDTAETLLRKLIEQNDPRYAPAGYILAVMLERKRVLKVKEQIVNDGKRVFIYEQPGTGDVFTIADPDLRLDQLEAVQRDVAALLEHGLNPPAPAPVTATETAAEAAPKSTEQPAAN